ncbi:MAG: YkvA family protein [Myxococcaceae bacterium]
MTSNALAYFRDPAVSAWRKLGGLAAMAYVAMPADAIPDIIPVLGWFDDLGVLGAGVWFMMREIRKHAERKRLVHASIKG